MTCFRALPYVLLLAASSMACASSTDSAESPPSEAKGNLDESAAKTADAPATPPAKTTSTDVPADDAATPVETKPKADPSEALDECLATCADGACVERCVEAFKAALDAEIDDGGGGDGDGGGRGGDATCCVGNQLWVCHAKGSNGASCNANLSPPGDDCERKPASDGLCR
ncbi:MAG: hypothetical protein KIT84_34840 [Labilithrix sp.]|nr:hypothetical protein [Labilithrix sp.]MCW5816227.1 hypothetical protein [Labilithrix sp.]